MARPDTQNGGLPTSLMVNAPQNHHSLKYYSLQQINNRVNRRLGTESIKQGRKGRRKKKKRKKSTLLPQTVFAETRRRRPNAGWSGQPRSSSKQPAGYRENKSKCGCKLVC